MKKYLLGFLILAASCHSEKKQPPPIKDGFPDARTIKTQPILPDSIKKKPYQKEDFVFYTFDSMRYVVFKSGGVINLTKDRFELELMKQQYAEFDTLAYYLKPR